MSTHTAVQPFPSSVAQAQASAPAHAQGSVQEKFQRRKGNAPVSRSQFKRLQEQVQAASAAPATAQSLSPVQEGTALPASHEVHVTGQVQDLPQPASEASSAFSAVAQALTPKAPAAEKVLDVTGTFTNFRELLFYCVPSGEHKAALTRDIAAATPRKKSETLRHHTARCSSYLSVMFSKGLISRKLSDDGESAFLYWRERGAAAPVFGKARNTEYVRSSITVPEKSTETLVKTAPAAPFNPPGRKLRAAKGPRLYGRKIKADLRRVPRLSKTVGPAQSRLQAVADQALADQVTVDHGFGVSSIHYRADIQVGDRVMNLGEAQSLHSSLGEALKFALPR